jgi:WS/DGAT/MGAT family acyltransferase
MHIGACTIYDPSTAPDGKVRLKDIMQFVEDRKHRAKTFTQKLKQVPLDFDRPYWMEDPDFNIEFHVRHIALPQPGDWRQLCIQVARLHARPLDLSNPLWEMTVIEGLDNIPDVPKGSYAIVTKVHHCAIDGLSGVEISEAIHSLKPEDKVEPYETARSRPSRDVGVVEQVARAGFNNIVKPMQAFIYAGRMAPGALKYAFGLGRDDVKLLGNRNKVPRTRFNGVVSAHRAVESVTISLEDIKKIRSAVEGSTVNDVVLAIVGGGLHRYLKDKDELPDDSLVAMAPISVRKDGEKRSLGNQVTAMSVPLGTDIADAMDRLVFTNQSATRSKTVSKAVGARDLSEMSKLAPAMVSGIATRLYSRLGLANQLSPMFNTVVTNVPGPPVPLYMAGARMVTSCGLGPVMDSMGLFHAVTSYCGEIRITVTACREMLPDPAFYANCLKQSIDEYIALGEAAVSGGVEQKTNRRKKRTRKKASKAKKKAVSKKTAGKARAKKAPVPKKPKGNGQDGDQPTLQ